MSEDAPMNSMNPQQEKREVHRAQANIEELTERISRANREDGTVEPLKGVHLHRRSSPTRLHSVSKPAFCVIAQGSKEVFLSDERYRYDPAHYLLVTAELPVVSHVIEASPKRPYLSFRLDLDPTLIGSVMVEAGQFSSRSHADARAINVSPLDANLLEAVMRLVRVVDSPTDARFLAPLITREIIYRLLMGAQSGRLRHISGLGGQAHHIAGAIERLRKDFNQPIRIENIAREFGMSISGFHHHFKAVTAMSPLQFQKQLQLQEARRLMLNEHLDAASAGYRVGYDNASHFTREYKRLFGVPPMRDVERLRAAAEVSADI